MKKNIGILVIVLGIVFSLLTTTLAFSAEKVEITYWGIGDDGANIMPKLVKRFNDAHPNIEVKYLIVPLEQGTATKLLTAIAGGNPPDAARLDRTMTVQWGALGSLVPLDEFMKDSGVKREDFYPRALDDCIWNDQVWALPVEADPCAMLFWNKDLFRQVGLNPEKPPKSIEELDELADKLTKRDDRGNFERIGFAPWLHMGFTFWPSGWAFGGEFYDPKTKKVTANDPKIVQAMEWVLSYAKKLDATRVKSFAATYSTAAAINPFIAGRLAMAYDGVWAIGLLKKYAPKLKYGWRTVPGYSKGGRENFFVLGCSVVIPKGSKHPKEAWEFINWLTSGDALRDWCSANSYLPAKIDVADNPIFFRNPDYARMISIMKTIYDSPPVMPAIGVYTSEIQAAQDAVIYFQKTPKQALDDVTTKVQAELNKYLR